MDELHSNPSNRTKRILILLNVVTAFLAVWFFAKHGLLKVRVAFADEQVLIFERMTMEAAGLNDASEIAAKLRYVLWYYPSGSKQMPGSALDRVVETSRSNAVSKIVSRLRVVSAKDHGGDPQKWLQVFPEK